MYRKIAFVERLGSSGSAAGSTKLARTFTHDVRYGVRSGTDPNGKQIRRLDLGADLKAMDKFPEGHYE